MAVSWAVFASNIYGTNIEIWKWKEILWTVDVGEVIDDDTFSNTVYDNICSNTIDDNTFAD